jgi:hypothetical protein
MQFDLASILAMTSVAAVPLPAPQVGMGVGRVGMNAMINPMMNGAGTGVGMNTMMNPMINGMGMNSMSAMNSMMGTNPMMMNGMGMGMGMNRMMGF